MVSCFCGESYDRNADFGQVLLPNNYVYNMVLPNPATYKYKDINTDTTVCTSNFFV